ncbi:S-layer homology domain-containing protein [Bacillus sp. Hm123]|uniref:S-layer homology domain-containing protein n=1 Tax=Bacillus sp. Hm123 TaxID=3450745 RepID=UPI003F424587
MGFQAKSYRKFVATAATATLVATAVTPAFAAEFTDVNDRVKDAVDYLVKNNVTQGMSETTFGTNQEIKRMDAAIWLAKALELDTDKAPDAGFTDVSSRGQGAVNALKAAGIINGKSETTFGANDPLTRGEMAKLITKAYDLDGAGVENKFSDVGGHYTDAVNALVKNEITSGKSETTFGTHDNIIRGDFAVFLYRAETLDVAPAEAKVESVKAIDAKTIEVKFNKAVDAKTLVKDEKDVITVVAGEGAADFEGVTQTLSEDGKTLTLTATKIFKGDYTVKVPFEIIKDVKGQFVSPINAKVTVNDKAAPVLTTATSTIKDTKDGLKKITLSFDEEVVSIDTVKINGVNYSAAVNGKEATVAVDLDATKTYDVTVVNATDAAGNVKDMQEAAVSVTVDNVAPSILSVVPAGENKVTVTVDKELAADTLNITGKIGTFATNIVTDVAVNPKNKKEYTVTLNNSYLFKNGDSDTVTLTVAKEALVDTLGNKNASEIATDVVVSKDATAPEVVKVATSTTDGKVTSFSVTYNEEVAAPTLAKAAVVNSKGEILPVASVVADAQVSAEDAKTVVFTLANGLATDEYSFDLAEGFVVDKALAPNKSAKYAFNVDVIEAGKPVETSFTIKDATVDANVITVDFGEKVKATGTGSALNPSAYQLNGVALPADTNIEFAKKADTSIDQTKVVITLPSGFVKANDEKAIFRVNAIQTLDNKVSDQFSKVLEVSDNTAPEVKSIVATDLTKLTVTYTEAIKLTDAATAADIQDEIKLVDSKGAAIAFTAAEVVEGGKLVLTVADATKVSSLTTVEVDVAEQDILDLNNVAQKAGVTVSK